MQPTRIQVMHIPTGQTMYDGPMRDVVVMTDVRTQRRTLYIRGHAFPYLADLLILYWP